MQTRLFTSVNTFVDFTCINKHVYNEGNTTYIKLYQYLPVISLLQS